MKSPRFRQPIATLGLLFLTILVSEPLARLAARGEPKLERVTPNQSGTPRSVVSYGRLPLSFEPNQGQTNSLVLFLARGGGRTLSFTPNEIVLPLSKGANASKPFLARNDPERPSEKSKLRTRQSPLFTESLVVRVRLLGANPVLRWSDSESYLRGATTSLGTSRSCGTRIFSLCTAAHRPGGRCAPTLERDLIRLAKGQHANREHIDSGHRQLQQT